MLFSFDVRHEKVRCKATLASKVCKRKDIYKPLIRRANFNSERNPEGIRHIFFPILSFFEVPPADLLKSVAALNRLPAKRLEIVNLFNLVKGKAAPTIARLCPYRLGSCIRA